MKVDLAKIKKEAVPKPFELKPILLSALPFQQAKEYECYKKRINH
jgi:hypothetical protein